MTAFRKFFGNSRYHRIRRQLGHLSAGPLPQQQVFSLRQLGRQLGPQMEGVSEPVEADHAFYLRFGVEVGLQPFLLFVGQGGDQHIQLFLLIRAILTKAESCPCIVAQGW